MKNEAVLILDFGSQYTQLIARRVRELGVYSEIKPCTIDFDESILQRFNAIILSGGPASVSDADAPRFDHCWLDSGRPILGICYGLQLLALKAEAKLSQGQSREYGKAKIKIEEKSALFADFELGEETQVWMSHGDHVDSMPDGYKLLASSSGAPVCAFGNEDRKIYALQFHPEVVHSLKGTNILSNFLFKISCLQGGWKPEDFLDSTISKIQEQVGANAQAICAISGGVDSTVAAVIVSKALKDRLYCIFVDNGLLREGEAKQVEQRYQHLNLNLKVIDAADEFLEALKDVIDPEQKRKIIGKMFIDIFEREAAKFPNATHLVQGTLYPDVIESESVKGPSAVIKSHHNVGGLPERMNLKLIEPLREMFKDEVRKVGLSMGLNKELIERQPFPGPGLAVRCLGAVSKDKLDILRKADKIFLEEVRAAGLYNSVWQSFAVLVPVKSVGVMGDGRTYEETIALRAVSSQDGMTADWVYFPEELLRKVSSRIVNEVKGVNRVVLDISSKPPATIEWE
jgi:GMP synthase (glutamine-hydrolysing)